MESPPFYKYQIFVALVLIQEGNILMIAGVAAYCGIALGIRLLSGKDSISVGINESIQDYNTLGSATLLSASRVHVKKLENRNYSVHCSFSEQKEYGSYTHRMLTCTVSYFNKDIPTYMVNDTDMIDHQV